MRLEDLDYAYPEDLVALVPSRPTRVAFVPSGGSPRELSFEQLLEQFAPGDLLVVNDTKVTPARVFAQGGSEILFLRSEAHDVWEVLFPARDYSLGDTLALPGDLKLQLIEKGIPQKVRPSRPIGHEYFERYGELALPPYIQQARGERHNRPEDASWYQTEWARSPGSVAAPTASLHFKAATLEKLRRRGVEIAQVTLHVGAGTFLPVRTQDLNQHVMHEEWAEVSRETALKLESVKARGGRIWALGTTVTRTLESLVRGQLAKQIDGSHAGPTRLFIFPPFEFQMVDVLLTNFHQPKSTLLALVAAFTGLENVKATYAWAIERKFRLFSYGDLSVWLKP